VAKRTDLQSKPVSIYLNKELYEQVQTKADTEMRSLSQTIVFIIHEYFKQQTPTED
jgi:hypothetical protein